MSITNGYCTLAELRGWTGISETSHTADDTRLEIAVEAASRYIDELCGRRFYTTSTDETRYYETDNPNRVWAAHGLDDVVSVTTLTTDEEEDRSYSTTWETTDYDLLPHNATLDGRPYTAIQVTPDGDYTFPTCAKGIKVVGKFGYGTTAPTIVKQACLILASYLFKQKDVPLGVQASTETGAIVVDPRIALLVRQMLDAVRKRPGEF